MFCGYAKRDDEVLRTALTSMVFSNLPAAPLGIQWKHAEGSCAGRLVSAG